MTLPTLPQQHKQKEASAGVRFKQWVEKNKPIACSYEMKQTTTDSIPFSCLEDKQIAFGLSIRSDKGAWIRVQGINGEPDYIWLRNTPSWVVIKYPKGFCIISISTFVMEKERSKRKSLTWERAISISISVIR